MKQRENAKDDAFIFPRRETFSARDELQNFLLRLMKKKGGVKYKTKKEKDFIIRI